MSMRVTQNGLYRRVTQQLSQQQLEVANTQGQIASGKKLQRPSDDPALAGAVLGLESQMRQNERYQTNLQRAAGQLELEEQAFSAITENLVRIKELLVQAANDTFNAVDRVIIRQELQELVVGSMNMANSRDMNGRYLFSGFVQGEPPYQLQDGVIGYHGSQDSLSIAVDKGVTMTLGQPGSALFGAVSLKPDAEGQPRQQGFFTVLQTLEQTLLSEDAEALKQGLDDIDQLHQHLGLQRTRLGARMNQIEDQRQFNERTELELRATLSQLQDLDYIEAVSRLKTHSLALQAGQQSFAQLSKLSLFNYLR